MHGHMCSEYAIILQRLKLTYHHWISNTYIFISSDIEFWPQIWRNLPVGYGDSEGKMRWNLSVAKTPGTASLLGPGRHVFQMLCFIIGGGWTDMGVIAGGGGLKQPFYMEQAAICFTGLQLARVLAIRSGGFGCCWTGLMTWIWKKKLQRKEKGTHPLQAHHICAFEPWVKKLLVKYQSISS